MYTQTHTQTHIQTHTQTYTQTNTNTHTTNTMNQITRQIDNYNHSCVFIYAYHKGLSHSDLIRDWLSEFISVGACPVLQGRWYRV